MDYHLIAMVNILLMMMVNDDGKLMDYHLIAMVNILLMMMVNDDG